MVRDCDFYSITVAILSKASYKNRAGARIYTNNKQDSFVQKIFVSKQKVN